MAKGFTTRRLPKAPQKLACSCCGGAIPAYTKPNIKQEKPG